MKQLFLLSLVVTFCSVFTLAQTQQVPKSTDVPENFVTPPININIVPGEQSPTGGTLLTNGVFVTTFPYVGAATPMGVAFDGTYYYVIPGGFSSDVVAQLDASFNLVTTQTVGLDMRSIFYNSADGEVYVKGYTSNGLFRLHTNPFDGGYDIIFTGIFQDAQTKAVLSADNTTMYDQYNGTARSYDFATGNVLNTFTLNLQHDLTWPRGVILAYTGTYLLTYANGVVYAYSPTDGSYIASCTLGSQPSSDEWSICYANGYFMVTDANDADYYVWTIDQGGVPVELTSFTANVRNSDVDLNWATATETNNQGFQIQRKSVDKEFEQIGYVAGFGTTTESKSYSFTDANLTAGSYTYRLKQLDFDGSYKYSKEVTVEVGSPANFELSQNYPNPFNPSTNIKYSIPENSFVNLAVYNLLGEKVSTLVNEEQTAGNYNLNFDATGLTSGTYIYQLRTGTATLSGKMLLLR
jgi:hypothetical protein